MHVMALQRRTKKKFAMGRAVSRYVLFSLGVATLVLVWLGPLPDLARRAFSAHMLMHMSVVAVAAPLLALGIAGGRLDPAIKAPRLFLPIPATVAELVIVWAWHAPALHHLARHTTLWSIVEQGTFLGAGLWLWLSAFGGEPKHLRYRAGAGVLALLLTAMHMTLLGALLALAPRPLYAHLEGFTALAPLDDQHLGGAIMIVAGGAAYLIGGLWLTAGLLRGSGATAGVRS